MLTVVVVLNVLISLLCLYVAWQVWNLRRALAAAADVLTLAERNTHVVLDGAPEAISQGQLGIHGARESYQKLKLQLQKIRQVLTILGLVQNVWRSTRRSRASLLQSRRLQRPQRSKGRR